MWISNQYRQTGHVVRHVSLQVPVVRNYVEFESSMEHCGNFRDVLRSP